MRTSIFAFASDLDDEGMDTVLANVQERAGLEGVTVAAAYHEGRDIFPHSPVRKVRFLESGALFFRPDPDRWARARIQPRVSELARATDPVAELCEAASARGLEVHAWTVFLHNDALAVRYPECAPRNAFGDPYLTELCPANPDVRAYATTLAADVARLGVRTILAESLHYHPLEHGYAHERYFIELGALSRYLLGLCFCEHCLEAARRWNVDADGVRTFVREELERAFARRRYEPEELDRHDVRDLVRGELGGYLDARAATVASLVGKAADAAGDVRLSFMDLSGAIKGYATGSPTGAPAPSIAWQLGVDLRAVAAACGSVTAIGYAAESRRLRFDLQAYRSATPAPAELSVALRPMPPDCDSAENLADKLRLARELGLAHAHLYHYGFMRLDTLDLIHEAVRTA